MAGIAMHWTKLCGRFLAVCVGVCGLGSCDAGDARIAAGERGNALLTVPALVNFQPASSPVPAGYTADTGLPFDAGRGFGWVSRASLSSSVHEPLDVSGNARDRARSGGDPRLETLIHMQYPPELRRAGVQTAPAAWELALSNGQYVVTVSVGDHPNASQIYDSQHTILVEGRLAIDRFQSTATSEYMQATVLASVNDGRLTLDSSGGYNTKINYVEVEPLDAERSPRVLTTSPRDAATNVSPASLIVARVALPNSGPAGPGVDLDSLNSSSVFLTNDGTGQPVPVTLSFSEANGTLQLAHTAPLEPNTVYTLWITSALRDTAGFPFAPFAATFTTGAALPPVGTALALINFQPQSSAVPPGYRADVGLPYDAARGFGWVTASSLSSATHTPLDLSPNTRDRARAGISPLLNTLIHMQYPASIDKPSAVVTPGAWEFAVRDGTYQVVVSAGDQSPYNSVNVINVEGVQAIDQFVPSANEQYRQATLDVTVSDGRLTIDPRDGINTKLDYVEIRQGDGLLHPSISSVAPPNSTLQFSPTGFVSMELRLPNTGGGVDRSTLAAGVHLIQVNNGAEVPSDINTSGGGDVIVVQPRASLGANATYRLEVTSALRDFTGVSFLPFASQFTTGSANAFSSDGVQFQQVLQATATGLPFTSLAIGPDHRLYAATLTGKIVRFAINSDGSLGFGETISTLVNANGPEAVVGMAFDPAATAVNPVLWVTHGPPVPVPPDIPADFSGKLTRLSGSALSTAQDFVIGLPRSIKDHMTNSIAFRPGEPKVIYVAQGSNSSSGAEDTIWLRPEHPLNAAILRVDLSAISALPLDVTTEGAGAYDAFATGAPVTIFASGIRNAFDLLWHSNGQLYVPTNGAAAHGNSPATPDPLPDACARRLDFATSGAYAGPVVPELSDIATAQHDYLFRVVSGGYYGHPNPARCEWVLNGGNPSAALDPGEVSEYPEGVLPDRNYRGFAYDFGAHYSPDGIIEYKSSTFGDTLRGKLLVARYSGGKDIMSLTVGGPNLDVIATKAGRPGLGGFRDPLDLTEDVGSGNLYVSELGAGRITLLRPQLSAVTLENLDGVPFPDRLVTSRLGSDPTNDLVHRQATVRVRNTGAAPLVVNQPVLTSFWSLVAPPAFPATLNPGASLDLTVDFSATSRGVKLGSLELRTNHPVQPNVPIELAGFWQPIPEGGTEPSLTELMATFGYRMTIVGPGQLLANAGRVEAVGDEVLSAYWRPADPTLPVSIRQLAAYHTQNHGAVLYWFPRGATTATALISLNPSYAQSVLPLLAGSSSLPAFGSFIAPGSFGLRVDGESSDNKKNDTRPDVANGCTAPCGHHMRFWPIKDRAGNVVPGAYLMGMDYSGINYDYNDNVYLITNATPDLP